jgi:hypothetical protein
VGHALGALSLLAQHHAYLRGNQSNDALLAVPR